MYNNSISSIAKLALGASLIFAVSIPVPALFRTFPGCEDLKPEHFRAVDLATFAQDSLWEPLKLEYHQVAPDKIDLYWTERRPATVNGVEHFEWGRIRKLDAFTGLITEVGRIPTGTDNSEDSGVLGILFDKKFATNGWVYISYVPPTVEPLPEVMLEPDDVIRFSRFTIRDGKLDLNSESYILEFPFLRGHPGGMMRHDDYGNTWFITGNSGWRHEEWSANTAELPGKLLRVRLMDNLPEGSREWGVGKSYTIPVNGKNFGAYWAEYFEKQGRYALAAKYRDTSLVRPEIFALGIRSPFSLQLDPVRQWATFGDCGPDRIALPDGTPLETEEWDVVTHPAFLGFPYWAGNNAENWSDKGATPQASSETPYNPMAANPVTVSAGIGDKPSRPGIDSLPPAMPGTYNYNYRPGACALDAFIYRYDPLLPSSVKMPPHMHRAWVTSDFGFDSIIVHQLTDDGSRVVDREVWYPHRDSPVRSRYLWGAAKHFFVPTTVEIGPDGALWVVNYGAFGNSTQATKIWKMEYVGPSCQVGPDFVVEKVGCRIASDVKFDPAATHHNPYDCSCANPADCVIEDVDIAMDPSRPHRREFALLSRNMLFIQSSGPHTVQVLGVDGRIIAERKGAQPEQYHIRDMLGPFSGTAVVRAVTAEGERLFRVGMVER